MRRLLAALIVTALPSLAIAQADLTSDFGPVTLKFEPQNAVMGAYSTYSGRLVGRIRGDGVLDLTWVQPGSERRCAEEREGSPFWGTVQWTPSGNALIGRWAYCDDIAGSAGRWNAALASGAIPGPAQDTAAVTDDDVYGAVRFEWGQQAALSYDHAELEVDLNCDGAPDRVLSRVALDNPDGPFFTVMMVASHNGDIAFESVFFEMGGDGGGDSVCVGADGPAPKLSVGARFDTGEFNDLFGYVGQCGQSVMLNDGMCDRKWLFWEPDTPAESRVFVFQN